MYTKQELARFKKREKNYLKYSILLFILSLVFILGFLLSYPYISIEQRYPVFAGGYLIFFLLMLVLSSLASKYKLSFKEKMLLNLGRGTHHLKQLSDNCEEKEARLTKKYLGAFIHNIEHFFDYHNGFAFEKSFHKSINYIIFIFNQKINPKIDTDISTETYSYINNILNIIFTCIKNEKFEVLENRLLKEVTTHQEERWRKIKNFFKKVMAYRWLKILIYLFGIIFLNVCASLLFSLFNWPYNHWIGFPTIVALVVGFFVFDRWSTSYK